MDKIPLDKLGITGRPKKIKAVIKRSILRLMNNNFYATIKDAIKHIREQFGVDLCDETVRLYVSSHMKFKKPIRTSDLTIAQKKKRYLFAMKNQHTDWSKVLFSDESRFQIDANNAKIWMSKAKPKFLQQKKYPGSMMVWGGISKEYKTDLIHCEGSIDALYYQKVLDMGLVKFKIKKMIFQQNGATPHTAKSTKAFLKAKKIKILEDWPPNSPDLNPIENLWAVMKQEVARSAPKNVHDLSCVVNQCWESLLLSSFHALLTQCRRE